MTVTSELPVRVLVPLAIDPKPPALGGFLHVLEGRTMGTRWCVKLCAPREIDAGTLHDEIQNQLDRVVAQMSPWEHDSDISRFNRAPAGLWHVLPLQFRQVMACAMQVAARSDGAFDPGSGELVNLWGFGPHGPVSRAPNGAAIDQARARSGWERLGWDRDEGRLCQPGGVLLDLSAIAKGFGVDHVSRHLRRLGYADHLVEVGGELRGAGLRPDGQPWWVELQLPPDARGLALTRIALHGLSVATSGDYVRRFDDGGVMRSHTLDPRTGRPIEHGLASVSVVHAECMQADALSTALTVLGLQGGLEFAQAHRIAALFVQRDPDGGLREVLSSAFQALAQ